MIGLGTASPEFSIAQADAARMAMAWCCSTEEEERRLQLLYGKSGVRERRSVLLESADPAFLEQQTFFPSREVEPFGPSTAKRMLRYERDSVPLGLSACRAALDDAQLDPNRITHLVTVSCTGFMAPGLDVALMQGLSLRGYVERTHVGFMGCHGALIGLRTAASFVKAHPAASVLLCCVELCSLHHQYGWRSDQVVANALFGDGAAAVILQSPAAEDDPHWKVAASGSILIPGTADCMGWHVRDHGFEMQLSAGVPAAVKQHAGGWLGEWLFLQDLKISDIKSWGVHPGGPKILEAAASSIGLPMGTLADSEETLADFGNMSSPTILFILDRLRRRQAPRPCVTIAFGPGLTMEATLFR